MKEGKGRNRTGSLLRRWKGKRYNIDDPVAKGLGAIYLKYTVGGKVVVTSLKTASIEEARKRQEEIMNPLKLASQAEVLAQTELRLKKVRAEQQRDWETRNPPVRFSEAWEAYLSAQNRPRSGSHTLARYASHYRQFTEWILTNYSSAVYMKDIGTREAEAYAEYLGSRKLSPSTYNQHLNGLSLVWAVLSEKAQAQDNPFAWDKKARKGIHRRSIKAEAHQRRKRPLTIEEIDAILKEAKGDYRTLIVILTCTGQRLVDGLRMEWSAVDFEKKMITLIPKKTSKRTGTTVYIPLFPQLEDELSMRKKSGRYVLPKLVKKYDRDAPAVSKALKKIFNNSGIKTTKETDLETDRVVTDVGAHSLRHTFVTMARLSGLPDPLICQITGHSSQEMVDHYTQFSEEMVATLAGKLLGSLQKQKELPVGSGEIVKISLPSQNGDALGKLFELASSITGKRNEKIKSKMLEELEKLKYGWEDVQVT